MPLISFIIPHYNTPLSMLKQCVKSILALSLNDYEREIIIIDDGSETCYENEFRHNGIVYVKQENQGLSMARNNGLDVATGEYIQFVDSDDYLIPSAYNKVILHVKEQHMQMLMFNFTSTEENIGYNTSENDRAPIQGAFKGDEYLLHNNLRAAAWMYIFRRDILGDLRFKADTFHEDSLFTPQLMMGVNDLYVMKEKAYFYRQHEGTIMHNRDKRHIQKRLDDTLAILYELNTKKESLGIIGKEAMKRVIDQQVMGYIYFIVTLTHSYSELRSRTATLKKSGLFPMPLRFYTLKYWLFALLTRFL